jgi:hypothetical protein
MSTSYLKPSTRGMRQPLDNGSTSDLVVNPPRFAQIGGLTSARKLPKKNTMTVKRPGSSEHK